MPQRSNQPASNSTESTFRSRRRSGHLALRTIKESSLPDGKLVECQFATLESNE
jgi:hypothetical protein